MFSRFAFLIARSLMWVVAVILLVSDVIGFPRRVVEVFHFLNTPIVQDWGLFTAAIMIGFLLATLDWRPVKKGGSTMPIANAFYVVAGVIPNGPTHTPTDADADAFLNAAETLRQAAANGEIEIWGRKWSSFGSRGVLEKIPKDYWLDHLISPTLLMDTENFDKHTLAERDGSPIEYTDLWTNRHQVLSMWPRSSLYMIKARNAAKTWL